MSVTRREFLLGTGAGLLLPKTYDFFADFLAKNGEPFLEKPKIDPRMPSIPKNNPRVDHERPKSVQERAKSVQNVPRDSQEARKTIQDAPRAIFGGSQELGSAAWGERAGTS